MREDYYYGHGKLLLTGEYFVLDGANSIALPTKLGQRMHVRYRPTSNPMLFWKSFDNENKCWFEAKFELWHFDILSEINELSQTLQRILRQARKQNIHFLRDNYDVHVETVLEFPLNWGLGSSSTLIYNIAQWAYVSPFELQQKVFGGSGYDIACAQSMGPITYQVQSKGPSWGTIHFNPVFKDQLYFVFLNQKQNTNNEINRYRDLCVDKSQTIDKLNNISDKILECIDLAEFEQLIAEHESIMSSQLDLPRVKQKHFHDYHGEIKSLGAWGGDFVLATSKESAEDTKKYFHDRGHKIVLTFDELILQNFQKYGEAINQGSDEQQLQTNC
tara:strand:+ start:7977 stop:8969 length:993 start_codon:yes stop_codon:yes gene_type:complete